MSRHEDIKRNVGVLTLHLIGMKRIEISRLYKISVQRVTQIVNKRIEALK